MSSWYRSKRRMILNSRRSFMRRNRRSSLNRRKSCPELSTSRSSGGHPSLDREHIQAVLRDAQHDVDGEARHHVDAEPRLGVILGDDAGVIDDLLLVVWIDVSGAEVEDDVDVEVQVDDEVENVPSSLRGLLIAHSEGNHKRDVHEDYRLGEVPTPAERGVRVYGVPALAVVEAEAPLLLELASCLVVQLVRSRARQIGRRGRATLVVGVGVAVHCPRRVRLLPLLPPRRS